MQELLKELAHFPQREQRLRKITRYSLYSTMWYRTNLWTHSRRVAWITEKLSPTAAAVFGAMFDSHKAYVLAIVHDDAEMIIGDIQSGNKSKMTEQELADIKLLERKAIDILAEEFPQNIGSYTYKELLTEALEKKSSEGIVMDWADKYDG